MIFVTDDITTIDVVKQFAIQNNMMSVCIHEGIEMFHFEDKDVPRIIAMGIDQGYLRVHLELGEWYYHPTAKGLALLDSKNSTAIGIAL